MYGIKINKDIEIPMNSNIDPKKCDDNLLHNKEKKIAISSDSKNNSNEYENID
jgi:hypothetical protein